MNVFEREKYSGTRINSGIQLTENHSLTRITENSPLTRSTEDIPLTRPTDFVTRLTENI